MIGQHLIGTREWVSEWVRGSLNIIERALCVWCQPCMEYMYMYIEVLLLCFNNKRHGRSNDWTSIGVRTHSLRLMRGAAGVSPRPVGKSRIIKMSRASHADDFSPSHFRGKIVWIYCCWLVMNTSAWAAHITVCICMHQAEAILRTRWGRKNCIYMWCLRCDCQ